MAPDTSRYTLATVACRSTTGRVKACSTPPRTTYAGHRKETREGAHAHNKHSCKLNTNDTNRAVGMVIVD